MMHICIFLDQHPQSLGGAQASAILQKKYLERLGHIVSICSPKVAKIKETDLRSITLPSFPLTPQGEYVMCLPSAAMVRRIDRELRRNERNLPPVDIVHVQADYWHAALGYRYAHMHNLPVVHTMHSNVEVGLKHVVPQPERFMKLLLRLQKRALRLPYTVYPANAWGYLAEYAKRAAAITAPSKHFAALLKEKKVATDIQVISNGLDDEIIQHISTQSFPPPSSLKLIWVGRFSAEKRILEFLEAFEQAKVPFHVEIYGAGPLMTKVKKIIEKSSLHHVITLHGKVSHEEALQAIAQADVLVQTSLGFETQGMTIYEAHALGTSVIFTDPVLHKEMGRDSDWLTAFPSPYSLAETLAIAYDEISQRKPQTVVKENNHFLQSHLSLSMEKIYYEILKVKEDD